MADKTLTERFSTLKESLETAERKKGELTATVGVLEREIASGLEECGVASLEELDAKIASLEEEAERKITEGEQLVAQYQQSVASGTPS